MQKYQLKIFLFVCLIFLFSVTILNRITAGYSLGISPSFIFSTLIIISIAYIFLIKNLYDVGKISSNLKKNIFIFCPLFVIGFIVFYLFPLFLFIPHIFIFVFVTWLISKFINWLYIKNYLNKATILILFLTFISVILVGYFSTICGINGCGRNGEIFSEAIASKDVSMCVNLKIPHNVRFIVPPFGIYAKENPIGISDWYENILSRNTQLLKECFEEVVKTQGEKEIINQCPKLKSGDDIYWCMNWYVIENSTSSSKELCDSILAKDYIDDWGKNEPKSVCYYIFAKKTKNANDCLLVDEEGYLNKNSCLVSLACEDKKPELCELLGKPSTKYGVDAQSSVGCKKWVQECSGRN